jgi:hypothetical protein
MMLQQTTVIRHGVVSLISAGVCVTLRILRSTGRRGPSATALYPSF